MSDKLNNQNGKKYDGDKALLYLFPVEAMEEVSKVLAFGGKKYGYGNWAKGLAYSRLLSACLRHLFAFISGEDNDPETGYSHLSHAACNIVFLIWMKKHRPDMDDRWIHEINENLEKHKPECKKCLEGSK